MLRAALGLAVLAVLLLPVGLAQADALVVLTFDNVPASEVSTNETVYVEIFTVHVVARNVVCGAGSRIDVTVTPSSGAPNGTSNATVGFELTHPTVTFPVPAGVYFAQPFEGREEVTLQIRPRSIPFEGSQVPVALDGTATQTGCQGNSQVAPASASQEFTVNFRRGTEEPPAVTSPEVPGFGWGLVVAGLGAVFVLRRASRGA